MIKTPKQPELIIGWREWISLPDFCILGIRGKVDTGASIAFFGAAVIRQFEMIGASGLNESVAITRSRDKLRSMQRQAPPGKSCSNLHRGGSASTIRITPEERSTAVRAAKTMGLNVCGVVLLRTNHGPMVMEVNPSPALEEIEQVTKENLSGKVINFIEKNAKPDKTSTRGKG